MLIGLLAWIGGGTVLGFLVAAAQRRHKRDHGRALLRRLGQCDYRVATGTHRGRWYSEVLVDELDDGTP